jgi:hypothetical protein
VEKRIASAVLLLLAEAAMAAPRLESVQVKPNPAPLEAGKAAEVVISVTIERPTPLDINCDAQIDPGDGGKFLMSWNLADRRTKTARYQYNKAGTYRLKVAGTGKDACNGLREVTVVVGSPSQAKATPPASKCPAGWTLVEQSAQGARYTCRAKAPAQPLQCTDGTNYFSERGEFGCR